MTNPSKVIILLAVTMAAAGAAQAQRKTDVVSTGKRIELKKVLQPEGTTALLFIQDTSAMEQEFLAELERQLPNDKRLALRVVRIKDVQAPVAGQLEVTATPTVIVYDRWGKVLARTSKPDEVRSAVRKGLLMGRLDWIDEDHEKASETYGAPREALRRGLPGIVKTMSMRPDAFRVFNIMSQIHFTDGFLKRREHEMVGAYVSALNKCKF